MQSLAGRGGDGKQGQGAKVEQGVRVERLKQGGQRQQAHPAAHPPHAPALFTSTSILPSSSARAQSAKAWMDAASVMSSWWYSSRLPASLGSSWRSWASAARPRSSLRAVSTARVPPCCAILRTIS